MKCKTTKPLRLNKEHREAFYNLFFLVLFVPTLCYPVVKLDF
jgi:hypothetical protein